MRGAPKDAGAAGAIPPSLDVIFVPISFGELIDKITILEIKAERIRDERKTANVSFELDLLRNTATAHFENLPPRVAELKDELRHINETLWEIEDRIRDCERKKDFGPAFIELARRVYLTNDRRAAVKRELCQMAGSAIREEKSYTAY